MKKKSINKIDLILDDNSEIVTDEFNNHDVDIININSKRTRSLKINGKEIQGKVSKIAMYRNPIDKVFDNKGFAISATRKPGFKILRLTIDFPETTEITMTVLKRKEENQNEKSS